MPFYVETRTVIVGNDLKDPVVPRGITVVDGIEFFAAKKTDQSLLRLFAAGSGTSSRRPLKHSNVFAKVVKIRDEAVKAVVAEPTADIDLGIDAHDDNIRRKRKKLAIAPDIVDIELPAVGEHPSVNCKALTCPGLHLELTSAVVNWLSAAMTAENMLGDEGEPDVAEDGNVELPQFVSFATSRQAYRVRYKGTSKWFSVHQHDDPLADAISFLDSLKAASSAHNS